MNKHAFCLLLQTYMCMQESKKVLHDEVYNFKLLTDDTRNIAIGFPKDSILPPSKFTKQSYLSPPSLKKRNLYPCSTGTALNFTI